MKPLLATCWTCPACCSATATHGHDFESVQNVLKYSTAYLNHLFKYL